MDKKILLILLILFASLGLGCANQLNGDSLLGLGNQPPKPGAESPMIFDPNSTDLNALPKLSDLPLPAKLVTKQPARTYTGVIKNSTKIDVVVPSLNSGATLLIPAHGWIEYVAYAKNFDVTVYSDGKPFYCLKIFADPKNYQYMCKQYDFIAEIVKPEAVKKPAYKKKRFKKKPKSDEGEKVG